MPLILGVDEAGRGPIAGPVAVGVVRAAEDFDFLQAFPGLNDSKKLSEKKREQLFALLEDFVEEGNVAFHVELVSAAHIDESGITSAVKLGVERGVRMLMSDAAAGRVVLDGLLKAPPEYTQETITGGDGIIPAIMLASVAAKVIRDRHMVVLAMKYPHYHFEKHKGYGTKAHYDALEEYGVCEEHRRSFLSKVLQAD